MRITKLNTLPILLFALFFPKRIWSSCGGTFREGRGVLSTPNFPHMFQVPINCEWVIESNSSDRTNSIVVYLTQLYLQEGLSFYEYSFYSKFMEAGKNLIHRVNDTNVIKTNIVHTFENFLVIRLRLDSIEGAHIRVLDNFLEVYGFNITYEITTKVREDRCTMRHCGFTGICYDDFKNFHCECLKGFSGPNCSQGPKSACYVNGEPTCKNGATCIQIGNEAMDCSCSENWKGIKCDTPVEPTHNCKNGYYPYDGKSENNCKCHESQSLPVASLDEDVTHIITMTLKKEENMRIEEVRAIIDNYVRELQARSITDHQKANLRKEMLMMKSLHVVNLTIVRNGFELKLGFFAKETEEKRVRLMVNRWMEQERFGNLTLADRNISRETNPILSIQAISNSPRLVRTGSELSLTCTGTGSPQMTFQWLKDNAPVNSHSPEHEFKLIEEKPGKYTAILRLKKVSVLDQGLFTCQVADFGLQLCNSTEVDVRTRPKVWLQPMSLTVRKGNPFRINCFSKPNYKHSVKYTYNWTKNKELLPVKTESEHYEILHPMGSILQVSHINRTTTYTCVVQDGPISSEGSVVVNVIDGDERSTCPGETHLSVLWPETAAGTEILQECPNPRYVGIARRRCRVISALNPVWQTPDYSQCTSEKLLEVDLSFQKLVRGYGFATPYATLLKYQEYVNEGRLLPGEGARILHLISDVVAYINTSKQTEISNVIFDVVRKILAQKDSLIDEEQIVLLQKVVKNQARISGVLLKRGNAYESYGAFDVSTAAVQSSNSIIGVPLPNYQYSDWFDVAATVKLGAKDLRTFANESVKLSMVVYRNLTEFLPQRSAIRMKDGSETEYEIISNVASVWFFKNFTETKLRDSSVSLEFVHPKKAHLMESWKLLCAVSDFADYGSSWSPHTCATSIKKSTVTSCKCHRTGTIGILLINEPQGLYKDVDKFKEYVVTVGCSLCLIMIFSTTFMLISYFFIRQSCIIFLKIQCCVSLLCGIAIFLYANNFDLSEDTFLHVMTSIECFMLMSLSSQLSKILIIYAEILHLPTKNVKQTIVGIITCAPIIAIFGNYIAHRSMNVQLKSWWLLNGSLSFNIFTACTSVIILLFSILYYIVMKNMLNVLQYDRNSDLLQKRLKLLKRSAFIFSSITSFVLCSILYVNYAESLLWHCIFSVTSTLLGLVIIVCYMLKSEISMKDHFLKKLEQKKKDKFKASSLKVFTKYDADRENESVPHVKQEYCQTIENVGNRNTVKPSCSMQSKYVSGPDSYEHYMNSPKQQQQSQSNSQPLFQVQISSQHLRSPDILASQTCTEVDLVASSLQNPPIYCDMSLASSSKQTTFYAPISSIIKEENNEKERARPDGEELQFHDDLPKTEAVNQVTKSVKVNTEDDKSNEAKSCDDLDEMMHQISSDLDYLLNGDPELDLLAEKQQTEGGKFEKPICKASSLRRLSKPHLSIEKIDEVDEEETDSEVVIKGILRTKC